MSDKQQNKALDDNIDEEPLSDQDLNKVEGGVDGSHSRSLHSGVPHDPTDASSNVLEPGPTFPVPPRPENFL